MLLVGRPHRDPAPGRIAGNDMALRIHHQVAGLAPGARLLATTAHGAEDVALPVDLRELSIEASRQPHTAETVKVDGTHQVPRLNRLHEGSVRLVDGNPVLLAVADPDEPRLRIDRAPVGARELPGTAAVAVPLVE